MILSLNTFPKIKYEFQNSSRNDIENQFRFESMQGIMKISFRMDALSDEIGQMLALIAQSVQSFLYLEKCLAREDKDIQCCVIT